MKSRKKQNNKLPVFEQIDSIYKYFICLGFGTIAYLLSLFGHFDGLTHLMIGWDAFALSNLVLTWVTFLIVNSSQIPEVAGLQDQSRLFVFFTVIISAIASISAITLLIVSKNGASANDWPRLLLAVAGMLFSWFLIHSSFALRYAHIYYGDHPKKPEERALGLQFPGDNSPDYMDFVYFSFVMGMTFQVSDVTITSSTMRRFALFHSIISFFFSTIIIALTISILS
ncbi:MAG: DUF1345 domain-containing protein [Bacteroidetes bacterium]|nr:DUF1345 domain-containing protein [Bacteroidota bacterium]